MPRAKQRRSAKSSTTALKSRIAELGGGTGLSGLLDRVQAFDGTLTIDSPSGGGTRLRAELPFEQ